MRVPWQSKILNLVQDTKKDRTYQAFQDIHSGLNAVKSTVESIKINSDSPFGKTDGTNDTFKYPQEPAFIVVNGVVKLNGTDFSYKNGYVKFNVAPSNGATIKGFHI